MTMAAVTAFDCRHCARRLPVGKVMGQVQVWCRHCKDFTLVVAEGS